MTQQIPEFPSFEALAETHAEGRDFKRIIRPTPGAKVAVIAPHGGKIEPRTDSIAVALAGDEFSLYCFISRLSTSAVNRHITSHRFNDADCVALVAKHPRVIAVHGWKRPGEAILIGGLDTELAGQLAAKSRALGVTTHTDAQGLSGTHPLNICNRSSSGRGVQLELSMALRRSDMLEPLLSAFRAVLLTYQNAD